jgi:hypothetical protein
MADFCKQCSIQIFGKDFEEMSGLCRDDQLALVICEGCGPVQVNHLGECVSADCVKEHGAKDGQETSTGR